MKGRNEPCKVVPMGCSTEAWLRVHHEVPSYVAEQWEEVAVGLYENSSILWQDISPGFIS